MQHPVVHQADAVSGHPLSLGLFWSPLHSLPYFPRVKTTKMLAVAVAAAVSLSGFLIAEVSTSYYEYPLNPSVQGHKKHTSHRQASSFCIGDIVLC